MSEKYQIRTFTESVEGRFDLDKQQRGANLLASLSALLSGNRLEGWSPLSSQKQVYQRSFSKAEIAGIPGLQQLRMTLDLREGKLTRQINGRVVLVGERSQTAEQVEREQIVTASNQLIQREVNKLRFMAVTERLRSQYNVKTERVQIKQEMGAKVQVRIPIRLRH